MYVDQDLSNDILLDDEGMPYSQDDLDAMPNALRQDLLRRQRQELGHPLRMRNRSGENAPKHVVYLMTDGEFHKIGRTGGDVQKRLSTIQSGNAREITLLETSPYLTYRESIHLEKVLHTNWGKKRVRGEWFKLNKTNLADVTNQIRVGVARKEPEEC